MDEIVFDNILCEIETEHNTLVCLPYFRVLPPSTVVLNLEAIVSTLVCLPYNRVTLSTLVYLTYYRVTPSTQYW
jgi:hypothetical protein